MYVHVHARVLLHVCVTESFTFKMMIQSLLLLPNHDSGLKVHHKYSVPRCGHTGTQILKTYL